MFFSLDPETAHNLALNLVRLAGALPPTRWLLEALFSPCEKPVEAFGLRFKNPLGLAAGYDKDGIAIRGLSALGFGHIEIGTVTPLPQPGNPKPRIFRLVQDEAVINRMGFPGAGMESVRTSLLATPRGDALIGVNLGKNRDTPLEEAAADYIPLVRTFASLVDYLVVNVSSPNTLGLRRLQGRAMLESLLGQVNVERRESRAPCPVLVKLAPDLTDTQLNDALDVILSAGMDGVIATNTSLQREGLRSMEREQAGGLSGRPIAARSEAMLEKIVKRLGGRVPVISVGGIMSPEDARRRLDKGATLVQVYTGLIYRGPGLVKSILRSL